MSALFFSYSHVDESLRDQLEIHLSALKRQGLISTWHDRRITAGSDFAEQIDQHIEGADVVLMLVSPDFIASDYCYGREMTRAMDKQTKGEARVIPVILRFCDWHALPFGRLQAVPKDGKAITTWPNVDEAFLDVVKAIKIALKEPREKANAVPATTGGWSDPESEALENVILKHVDRKYPGRLDTSVGLLANISNPPFNTDEVQDACRRLSRAGLMNLYVLTNHDGLKDGEKYFEGTTNKMFFNGRFTAETTLDGRSRLRSLKA